LLPSKQRKIKREHPVHRHTPILDQRFVEANEAEALHKFSAKPDHLVLAQLAKQDLILII
jgi:hypothetical protein